MTNASVTAERIRQTWRHQTWQRTQGQPAPGCQPENRHLPAQEKSLTRYVPVVPRAAAGTARAPQPLQRPTHQRYASQCDQPPHPAFGHGSPGHDEGAFRCTKARILPQGRSLPAIGHEGAVSSSVAVRVRRGTLPRRPSGPYCTACRPWCRCDGPSLTVCRPVPY